MLSKTELQIFKNLDEESSVKELALKSGLDVSTVSKYVNQSLEKENGLFEKRREGKKVYVSRSGNSHSNMLWTIVNEYPRWNIKDLFSHSHLRIAAMMNDPKRIKDIVFVTGLSRQYIRRCLKDLTKVGIVIKENSKYKTNPDIDVVKQFISSYYSYKNEKKVKELSSQGVLLWQRGDEFLFKTPERLDEGELKKTAVSRFYEFDIPLLTDSNYYFRSERELDLKDIIIHTVLIDRRSVTYNTYSLMLYKKERPDDIISRARIYDIEEHFKDMLEFLETKEKVKPYLPAWEEFKEIAEEYEVAV